MSSRVFPSAVALALLGLPSAARAQQPDPELKTPYLWRVVVQTRPHPLITPAFLEYAQARGFHIDPTRARSPRDKARVENQVPFVREPLF